MEFYFQSNSVMNSLKCPKSKSLSHCLTEIQSIKINIGPSDGGNIFSSTRRSTVLYWRVTDFYYNKPWSGAHFVSFLFHYYCKRNSIIVWTLIYVIVLFVWWENFPLWQQLLELHFGLWTSFKSAKRSIYSRKTLQCSVQWGSPTKWGELIHGVDFSLFSFY